MPRGFPDQPRSVSEDAARAHTLRIKEQTRYTSDVRDVGGIDIAGITRARSLTLDLRVDTHIAPITRNRGLEGLLERECEVQQLAAVLQLHHDGSPIRSFSRSANSSPSPLTGTRLMA